jgi:hypothetical protein
MLKLPALQDLDIRDAVDGDVLTFDASRGMWVARALDAVQLPKVHPEGDPDSYYTPPATSGTYAENLFPNPELRTAGTGVLPKWIYDYYAEYPDSFTQPTAGDGSKSLRLSGDGTLTYLSLDFDSNGGEWPVYLDETKVYIFSVDFTISSPVPVFYPYMPVTANVLGSGFRLNYEAASLLAPGTYRVHVPLMARFSGLGFGLSLQASIESDFGYIEWSNLQMTETVQAFQRTTHSSYPDTETIDVTSSLEPGKSYLVNDEIVEGEPFSFSIEATTPSGSEVLWSRDETQWPQAIVTIPEDAISISYTTVKPPSSSGQWHNIIILEAPPEFFEGSTTDTPTYTYSWASTADDSTSIRTPN